MTSMAALLNKSGIISIKLIYTEVLRKRELKDEEVLFTQVITT